MKDCPDRRRPTCLLVGAGSAGVIAALRLAQNSKETVLLIEAGAESAFLMNIPLLGPLIQRTQYDWQYQTEPQENACLGLKENRSNWPMGRVVGGTGRLNNMIYVRGHSLDYDSWSAAGNPTWGYNEQARTFFKVSERQKGRYVNDSLYHSFGGVLPISDLPYSTPFSDAIMEGGAELGYNVGDLNGKNQTGFMKPQVYAHNGSRYSLDTYIESHAKNIRLLANTVVYKVLFKSNFEAMGVRFLRLGKRKLIRARKTVILTAGVIGTPKILMLSGIGPKEHLKELGIPLILDLPGVGQNLQDHVTTGLDLIKLKEVLPFSVEVAMSPFAAFDYFKNGKGPWTFPGCEAIALFHSQYANPNADPPDLQLMAIPIGVSSDRGMIFRKNLGISNKMWNEYFLPLVGQQVVSIFPVLLHPKSRGEVLLRSRKPFDNPIINPRYLTDPHDMDVLYEGFMAHTDYG